MASAVFSAACHVLRAALCTVLNKYKTEAKKAHMNFSSHRHFKVCWDALTCLLYDISCLLRFAVLCAEDWNALNCVLYIVFYIFLRPVHCFAMLRGVLRAVRSCPVFEFYVLNHNASHYVNFSWILLNERILSCQACALCHDFK